MRVSIDQPNHDLVRQVMRELNSVTAAPAVNYILSNYQVHSSVIQDYRRFQFACAALTGMLASESEDFVWEPATAAARAQEIADALMLRFSDLQKQQKYQ